MSIGRILKASNTVEFAGSSCDIKKGEDGRIIGRKPIVQSQESRETKCSESNTISAEPVSTLSRFIAGTYSEFPLAVDAVRALIRAGSITRVRVINDFPPFICDSVNTTRKQILYVRSEQHDKPKSL